MPRIVSISEKLNAVKLMRDGIGQREIEKETGLSRPFIRKIAREIGHQFPRNGVEVLGTPCMCVNCGTIFRRPKSKILRARNQFCDDLCKVAYFKGSLHPSWKKGKTASSFSEWIKNSSAYDEFKKKVLERDNNKCVISGRIDNLHVHHIFPKAEGFYPEKSLDINNGITLNEEIHREIHSLIKEGIGYEQAVEKLKNEYKQKNSQ
jgi:5-methylcytosine-specific restriction endonuclease McrA